MRATVAIVEDDAAIAEELRHIIERAGDLACVGICRNLAAATSRIPPLRPDVIVMDIRLPDGSGIDCTARLKRLLPEAQVLMFTIADDTDQIVKALEAGASGYVLKEATPAEILNAIHEVRQKGVPMSREVARKLIGTFHRPAAAPEKNEEALTPREEEILRRLSEGLLYKEIGEQLGISIDTVGTHIKSIYRKLNVRSRTEAVMKYFR